MQPILKIILNLQKSNTFYETVDEVRQAVVTSNKYKKSQLYVKEVS